MCVRVFVCILLCTHKMVYTHQNHVFINMYHVHCIYLEFGDWISQNSSFGRGSIHNSPKNGWWNSETKNRSVAIKSALSGPLSVKYWPRSVFFLNVPPPRQIQYLARRWSSRYGELCTRLQCGARDSWIEMHFEIFLEPGKNRFGRSVQRQKW